MIGPHRDSNGTALLFDLDGVIVDSMPMHTRAWQLYLQGLGIEIEDLETRMHGRHNDAIVAEFIGADLPADAISAHGSAKERLYRELMGGAVRDHLVPGVREFLDASDLPMAVASNAETANVSFVLQGAGICSRFRAVVDGGQVERPKPFPDIYLRAARLLGTDARRCVVFEDSPAGIEAARAAGAKIVGVGTHTAELRGTDLTIRDFRDPALGPWLESIQRRAS